MKAFVALVLLAHVSQHASEVEVEKGKESVLLPCHFPPAVLKDHTVVWRRDDLRSEIIHTLRINYLSDQNDRYTHRTSMRVDALQTGDLSLTLRNPTYTDTGNYTCATRNAGRDQNTTEVLLLVKEPPLWPKVLPSVLVPVVLLGAIIIFLGYRISKRQKRTAVDQLEAVEVEVGEKSVLLPYKTTDLPEGFKVQWIYLKDEHSIICVYENGQIQTNKQDATYQTRTEMKISQLNQMETEELNQTEVELSLTLRNPRCEDGGVYICVVCNKEGKALKMKVVILWVKESFFMAAKASILNGKCTRRRMSSIPVEQLQTESTL